MIIEKNTEMKKLEDNIAATLTRVSELQRKLEQLEETVSIFGEKMWNLIVLGCESKERHR